MACGWWPTIATGKRKGEERGKGKNSLKILKFRKILK